jgi:hypothetical protein
MAGRLGRVKDRLFYLFSVTAKIFYFIRLALLGKSNLELTV